MAAWTTEDRDLLIDLVSKNVPWCEIAQKLGRSANACKTYYGRRVDAELKVPNFHRVTAPDLTKEQIEEAARIRLTGPRGRMDLRDVAKIMGVREVQLLRVFAPDRLARDKKRQRTRAEGRGASRLVPIQIPAEVLDERERSMRPMSLTRELMGDPRPGRSALDKKRAA